MSAENDQNLQLLKLMLPKEIFDFFEITKLKSDDKKIKVYLDENNTIPDEFKNQKVHSKGFYDATVIQDFPIRERAVFLHVRRRRWTVVETNEVVSRQWETVAKGSRYTKGFATFLKDLHRDISRQL